MAAKALKLANSDVDCPWAMRLFSGFHGFECGLLSPEHGCNQMHIIIQLIYIYSIIYIVTYYKRHEEVE